MFETPAPESAGEPVFTPSQVASGTLNAFTRAGASRQVHVAKQAAYQAHNGQEYGAWGHMSHVEYVVQNTVTLVNLARTSPMPVYEAIDILAVAYLHDVLEDSSEFADTDFTPYLGSEVDQAVRLLTNDPSVGDRDAQFRDTHRRMREVMVNNPRSNAPYIAILVKLADRLANVSTCLQNLYDAEIAFDEEVITEAEYQEHARQLIRYVSGYNNHNPVFFTFLEGLYPEYGMRLSRYFDYDVATKLINSLQQEATTVAKKIEETLLK